MAIDLQNINKLEMFTLLLEGGLTDIVSHLEKNNIEQPRQAANEIRTLFKKEFLFTYLKTKAATSEDDNVVLWNTGKGYVFQPHFKLSAIEDSNEVSETEVKTLARQKLNDFVRNEYPSFKSIKPDTLKDKMIRYVISQTVDKTLGVGRTSDLDTNDSKGDTEGINKVLRNFTMKGKGTRYTVENAEHTTNKEISWASSNLNDRTLEEWKRTLEAAPTQNLRQIVSPFLNLIEARLSTDKSIRIKGVKLDADKLLGKLDLKFLSRREDIYSYWEEIDGKYEDVRTTVKEFATGLKNMETSNENLQEVMQEFMDIADVIESEEDSYKYILPYQGKTMKDWARGKDKVTILFETFMDTKEGTQNSEADFQSNKKKLIEEMAIDPSKLNNEDLGISRGKAPDSYSYLSEDGDKVESTSIDAITPQKADEETRQASRLKKKLGDLTSIEVDPLYYYVYASENKKRNNFSAWSEWPVFSREINRIKKQMKMLGDRSVTIIDDDIEDYVDLLAKQAVVATQEKYYLPVTEELINETYNVLYPFSELKNNNFKVDEKQNLKNIGEFLDVVSMFISSSSDFDKLSSPTTVDERGPVEQKKPTTSSATIGRKDKTSMKTFLADIAEVEEEFGNMLDAIIAYYVVPVSSRYRPFDGEIKFGDNSSRLFKILTQGKSDTNSFFMLLAMEQEYGATLIDDEELESLVNALEFITTPSDTDFVKLKNYLEGLQVVVVEILGGLGKSFKEDSKIEIGTFLNEIITKNKLNDVKIFGRNTSNWKEDYNPSDIYPLEAIESHLSKYRKDYAKNKELEPLIDRFFGAIDDMDIVKSEDELKILNAHDDIRKMMEKPVYYNTSKLNNYNHVNTAIHIVKKLYQVDVSVTEVEQIVNEIDSMSNISQRHGIPIESVYYLKANFR